MSEQNQQPNIVELVKSEYIFKEGNEAKYAYVLTEGNIEILKHSVEGEQILANVAKGAIFGEMAIIDGSPRSASARAASNCKVQEIDKKAFIYYLSKNPEAAFNMMVRLSGYVRSAEKKTSGSMLNFQSKIEPIDHKESLNPDFSNSEKDIEDTEAIYSEKVSKPVIISTICILFFIFSVTLWSSLTFVEKTVSARGKFSNISPNIEIQSTSSSVVNELFIERGQTVRKGDILAVLDGTVVNANFNILNDKINALENKILRLELQKYLISGQSIENALISDRLDYLDRLNREILEKNYDEFIVKINNYSTKIKNTRNEINFSRKNIELIREQLDISIRIEKSKRNLFENDVVTLVDVLSATNQRISVSLQLQSSITGIEKMKSNLDAIVAEKNSYISSQMAQIVNEFSEYHDRLLELREELVKNNLDKNNLLVKSPVEGVVLNLPTISIGTILTKGEPIVTLVRTGLPLILEIDIDPKDISDVSYSNPVSVKLDSLPFQQYGDLTGTLVYISSDTVQESVQGDPGIFYKGRVKIEQSEINRLPEDFNLTPGMLANADLKVGERRLITYFTNPILKSLSNAMREPD